MKPCPLCQSPMTLETGLIGVPCVKRFTNIIFHQLHLGRFWSCGSCEHCEEAR